jgi:SlyX protein
MSSDHQAEPDGLAVRVEALEVSLTYQAQTIEDLNRSITDQWTLIEQMRRALTQLLDRVQQAETQASAVGPAEPPPPHY